MTTFNIPQSVRDYHIDKALREAVDALIEVLDGSECPSNLSRKESREHNRALLMSAKVRHDYIEMIHDLWDVTFGLALKDEQHVSYESHEFTVAEVWDNGTIACTWWPNGTDTTGYELYVLIESERPDSPTLHLAIWSWNERDGYQNIEPRLLKLEYAPLWTAANDDGVYLRTLAVPMQKFINAPESCLPSLKAAAEWFVNAIRA